MSDTPKKIEFMIMKDSAAELVIASSVAFIDSEESYQYGVKHGQNSIELADDSR